MCFGFGSAGGVVPCEDATTTAAQPLLGQSVTAIRWFDTTAGGEGKCMRSNPHRRWLARTSPEGQQDAALGRHAIQPSDIPWRGWRQVIRRTYLEIISDRISLIAAGCAFYATLALFPAITMLISIYGLVFDPKTVEPQLQVIQQLLPPAAFSLIAERVHSLVSQGKVTLGFSVFISTMIALWSSSTGTKSMISALNMAYEESERRSFLRFQAIGLTMTLCGILGAIVALVILVFLPVAIEFVGLDAYSKALLRVTSFGLLIAFVMTSLSLLYYFGPSRESARWHWITPGSSVATLLWLAASVIFSLYVGHIASYDTSYGPIGAVVGVMMWFWVSAYAVLLGAELNAELELQTSEDTTTGPPKALGERGAFVADHVAED
jgi:membrane protein